MAESTGPENTASVMDKMRNYLKTLKGKILAAEVVISLVITICYGASMYSGYLPVSVTQMIFAGIIFCVYMLGADKMHTYINWLWTDFIRATIGTVIYLITSVICMIGGDGARITGAVFGLLAGILFGYDAYLIFQDIKSKRQHTPSSTDEKA